MIVHDLMSCVTAPDGLYDASGPGLTALLYLCRRATRVVCISNDTRTALLRQVDFDPARVAVVPTGNLLAESRVSLNNLPALPARFLLFVGERSGRKGFYQAVRAMATIFKEQIDIHLICTGRLNFAEEDYVNHFLPLSRVRCIVADDAMLVHLYRNAICLVYPSQYEGFGLPVIEAMHFGCPVVTTRCGALEEISGDAALFVDPHSIDDIRSGMERIIRDNSLREDLAARGALHAKEFSYKQMLQGLSQQLAAAKSSMR